MIAASQVKAAVPAKCRYDSSFSFSAMYSSGLNTFFLWYINMHVTANSHWYVTAAFLSSKMLVWEREFPVGLWWSPIPRRWKQT